MADRMPWLLECPPEFEPHDVDAAMLLKALPAGGAGVLILPYGVRQDAPPDRRGILARRVGSFTDPDQDGDQHP
jgi:hypothetical protein